MPTIYRSMIADGDKPQVGSGGKLLGVRPSDIPVDGANRVQPATGGMSVAPAWRRLLPHLIPRRLRHLCGKASGPNRLRCWRMGEGRFVAGPVSVDLALRPDAGEPDRHGFIEPIREMPLSEYTAALAATRDEWERDEV